MNDWKSLLSGDPIDWLLEENNPSVRFFTLTEILNKPKDNAKAILAKKEIMKSGLVPKILNKQINGEHWLNRNNFYIKAKYKGTVWSLILLAELNADGNNERIKKTCEFILNNSQHRESGGFSARGSDDNGGTPELVIPCLTGNMIWALIKFGYLEDSRVQDGIECILKYQRYDDGIDKSPSGWPYEKKEQCWGKHTCHMGVVKNLKALSEIPPNIRSKKVEEIVNRAVDYLLNHRIYKKSHDQNIIAKQEWTQFGFPLMWKIDALEVLDILTRLGCKDDRMRDAFDLVISKQDKNGRWKLEKSFNGRMQVRVEQIGKESKWITLNALKVLKKYYDLTN